MNKLQRMDALLTMMNITDLHPENVIAKRLPGEKKIEDLVPIDLEVRGIGWSSQLGTDVTKFELTVPEKK